MTLLELLRRFLWHVTTAFIALFVILLLGEYFVPGSVLPFVDLVDGSVFVVGLIVLTTLAL